MSLKNGKFNPGKSIQLAMASFRDLTKEYSRLFIMTS